MVAPALNACIQGSGQVSADNLNTYVQSCDTFANLRAFVGLPGIQVECRGGISIADGLQGTFYWSASNPGPDNGATVIVPTGSLIGAWVKLPFALSASGIALGQARFAFNSSTQVALSPYNGNSISIAGVLFSIPAAGITAGNTGTFVNGIANQSLVASTGYYVYAFNNSGTPALDFSTTGYSADTTPGNIGVYIKNGTPSRSLVGYTFINSGGAFNDSSAARNTLSWFNRQRKPAQGAYTNGTTTASVNTLVDIGSAFHMEMSNWADGDPCVGLSGNALNNTQNDGAQAAVGDGSTTSINPGQNPQGYSAAAVNTEANLSCYFPYGATEGHHIYFALGAAIIGGIAGFNLTVVGETWG